MRVNTSPGPLKSLLVGLSAVAIVTSGCSSSAEPPSYGVSDAVTARVLPQLASVGEDTEAADDAEWVVEVRLDDVEAGTTVALVARQDGGWETVDETESNDSGEVALTTTATGDLHVVVGDGDDAIGAEGLHRRRPGGDLHRRLRRELRRRGGRHLVHPRPGLRAASGRARSADASAAEVLDGVLRLSVLDDPEREATVPAARASASSTTSGSTATSAPRDPGSFTYGFAAARIKTQAARGQHSAFWMQAARRPDRAAARRRAAPRSTSWSTSATTTPRAA